MNRLKFSKWVGIVLADTYVISASNYAGDDSGCNAADGGVHAERLAFIFHRYIPTI